MPETVAVMDVTPLPNEPINADIGRYRAARPRTRRTTRGSARRT